MREPPQVQVILSSNGVSEEDARNMLSRFILHQKNYFDDAHDVDNRKESSDEDYMNMDEDNDHGTFEETQVRLGGIVRSLSGIKKLPELAPLAPSPNTPVKEEERDQEDDDSGKKNISETKLSSKKSEIAEAARKAEKEAKKSAKKAKKEARRSERKTSKSAKKEKKKRKSVGTSDPLVKRSKIEN
uniref:Uncharacterized protein n=1 Tax=Chaetoceros debilis TaxID=122233 RepID=A0A7S3Q3V1_9STRA|mmetsp:Transcript_29111/g.44436  ORF Transcript_29111/g.44436 Transcript_29111/m.44436 type:complete len:186 (-) Transcript_29111:8-565(-)